MTQSQKVTSREDRAGTVVRALDVVAGILSAVGIDRVELVTFTRDRINLQPADLTEGEQIARVLGLDTPLDHRMFVPGHTLWTGSIDGLEVQVRSALRQAVGVAR
jgi:hypothetical protein